MQVHDFVDELERQGQALGASAALAGLAAKVPTCPAWTVAKLVAHTGKVHRWATSHLLQPRRTGDGAIAKAPAEGLLDWYAEGHAALVDALRQAPEDVAAWTFLDADSPLSFWARRQAHETAIHRADADSALGEVPSYDQRFAADGVSELIDGFYGRRGGKLLADQPRTLLVRLADDERVWHVTIGPDGRQIEHDDSIDAQAEVVAESSQMYLFLWNRLGRHEVQVSGDESVLDLWRTSARITW